MGGDDEQDLSVPEMLADPVIVRVLTALGRRIPADPCPRCMTGRVSPTSRSGFCQPCTTEHDERIKASKRRSYHRRKQFPADTYGQRRTSVDTGEEVSVGGEGWRLLTVAEAAEKLHLARSTVNAMIADGRLRSLKLGRARRVPADAIVELVERAEAESRTAS